VFGLVGSVGLVPRLELERTLNMGVGMVAVVPPESADAAVALLAGRGLPAWVAGTVAAGDGTVTLTGAHPA
jgi:phosphoribosylformylglycinamidine cyclo-ligase